MKKNISPADYANRLKETGKHLVLEEIDPSLQKSVGAALQSSYELLSDDLRQKLRFLAVFPDTFDLAATAAVWDVSPETSQDAMGELLAYSLAEFDEITNRYNLHDLVRLFAGQLLSANERYTAQKRHAGHYLGVMRAADALYEKGGESVTQGLALFDLEVTNIRAGHDWVVAYQHADDTLAEWCFQYPHAGVDWLFFRQHPRERIRWLEPALSAARRLKRRNWEGAALGNLGIAYYLLGESRRAIEYHGQSLQMKREIGDRLGEANSLFNSALALDQLGNRPAAIARAEAALKIHEGVDAIVLAATTVVFARIADQNLGHMRLQQSSQPLGGGAFFESNMQLAAQQLDQFQHSRSAGGNDPLQHQLSQLSQTATEMVSRCTSRPTYLLPLSMRVLLV